MQEPPGTIHFKNHAKDAINYLADYRGRRALCASRSSSLLSVCAATFRRPWEHVSKRAARRRPASPLPVFVPRWLPGRQRADSGHCSSLTAERLAPGFQVMPERAGSVKLPRLQRVGKRRRLHTRISAGNLQLAALWTLSRLFLVF